MASTADHLAQQHLYDIFTHAATLHVQVHQAWKASRVGEETATPLAKLLHEAANAVAQAEARMSEAYHLVVTMAAPGTVCADCRQRFPEVTTDDQRWICPACVDGPANA